MDNDLRSMIKDLRATPEDSALPSRLARAAQRANLLAEITQQFVEQLTEVEWIRLVEEEGNRREGLLPDNWVARLRKGDSVWLPEENMRAIIEMPFRTNY